MLNTLINDLSRSDAYPHEVDDVVVCQTHISVVFLAGNFAYKLKKPVDLGFVDYSTLDKRRHFCRREVELNQRLAPGVYLRAVPIVCDGAHRFDLEFEGDEEEVAEWAVLMRRLDDGNRLGSRLSSDRIAADLFERLGRHIAQFHDGAKGGAQVAACATFEQVQKNNLDNFDQATAHVGQTVDHEVFQRLRSLVRRRLDELEELISSRARRNIARDTHGDLRLEHIYIEDDGHLRIVDCIEFNDAFRYADPVSDIAFLAMDLDIRGYGEESRRLLDAYFDERDDDEGRRLIDFYVAYRSCVRAKVHGFKAAEPEVDARSRRRARQKARAHWNYALWRLEEPGRGPSLVMLAGLPATGKSTLGRKMLDQGRIDVLLDSDAVRKELAGIEPDRSAHADFESGIYTPSWSDRTYRELAHRAKQALKKGQRVAIAATFVRDDTRRMMIDTARSMGVPVRFVECTVSDSEAHRRIQNRRGDASDADLEIYERLAKKWETPSPEVERVHKVCNTSP